MKIAQETKNTTEAKTSIKVKIEQETQCVRFTLKVDESMTLNDKDRSEVTFSPQCSQKKI